MSGAGERLLRTSSGRMRRRDFLAVMAGATACPSLSRAAQRRDPLIGYLYHGSIPMTLNTAPLWRALADRGYVRGRNLRVEFREAHDDASRLPDLARDLVRREVSVIVVPSSGPALFAAKAATATIPIVFVNSGDPIRMGYVKSLSRPGGNVTGISDFGVELSAKRLELIKMLVPSVSRIGILITNYPGLVREFARPESDAGLSIETVVSVIGKQQEIDAAFAAFADDRLDGVCLTPSPLFYAQRAQIVALAARYRLPAVYPYVQYPQIGGLMSYGTDLAERSYQTGVYTGLILDGADPADLPVHRLSRFDLVVNMSTARALGLTVPARFLALTDQVIE
jgi:putative ABC transport system substrate-binding protein